MRKFSQDTIEIAHEMGRVSVFLSKCPNVYDYCGYVPHLSEAYRRGRKEALADLKALTIKKKEPKPKK